MTQPAQESQCRHCHRIIPPSAVLCPFCKQNLSMQLGATETETTEPGEGLASPAQAEPVKPFDPAELPAWIRRLDWTLALGTLALLVLLELAAPRPDRGALIHRWLNAFAGDFAAGFRPGSGWQRQTSERPAVPAFIVAPPAYSLDAEQAMKEAAVPTSNVFFLSRSKFESYDDQNDSRGQQQRRFVLQITDGLILQVQAEYYDGSARFAAFTWRGSRGFWELYPLQLFGPLILIVTATGARTYAVRAFRLKRRDQWLAYEKSRTTAVFKARDRTEEARQLWLQGESAKALVELRRALVELPGYAEALDLRRVITNADAQVSSGVLSTGDSPRKVNGHAGPSGLLVMLRVVGTPYGFQAPVGATTITLGRQRSGEHDEKGNDVVIRVPGSTDRSRRISKHHLVIERIADDFFATDLSQNGTILDGKRLVPGEPAPLRSGSRLILADVVTLEVAIRSSLTLGNAKGLLPTTGPVSGENGVQMEATVGQMFTIVEGGL